MTRTAVESAGVATRRTATGSAGARAGYVVGAAINLAILGAVNVWPGWQAVPFLTEETPQVLGLVNLSLATAVVANLVYLIHDAPWLRALGGLVTTSVGLAAVVRALQVFPVVDDGAAPVVARVVLVLGVVGSVIGLVVQLVTIVRAMVAAR